ncbi:hypothetical protein FRC06_007503, partial [Ceratobasidium sp. 370]
MFSVTVSPHLSCQCYIQHSGFNSQALCPSKFANLQSGSGLETIEEHHDTANLGKNVFRPHNQAPTAPAPTSMAPAPVSNFNTLYNTVLGSIPPTSPAAPVLT